MANSIPYLIFTAIIAVLYFGELGRLKGVSKSVSINLAYLVALIFIGLRGHAMTDYVNYVPTFSRIPNITSLSFKGFDALEPGFVLYTSLIKSLGFNYFGWVFINTLIDFVVLRWFFRRYSPSQVLPIIFFITFSGLVIEFNLYRNSKAIILFLLSFPYLIDRKIIPYIIINLLALTFHNSAVIFIPLYFILNLRIPIWMVWTMVISANVIFLCNIKIIGVIINNLTIIQQLDGYDKLMAYAGGVKPASFSIGFFERLFAIIVFTVLRGKLIEKHKYYCAFYNSYLIYYLVYTIFYEVPVFINRFPVLFVYSYWILYPAIIYLKYSFRRIINMAVSLLVALKIFATCKQPDYAYENILWDDISYSKSMIKTQRLLENSN